MTRFGFNKLSTDSMPSSGCVLSWLIPDPGPVQVLVQTTHHLSVRCLKPSSNRPQIPRRYLRHSGQLTAMQPARCELLHYGAHEILTASRWQLPVRTKIDRVNQTGMGCTNWQINTTPLWSKVPCRLQTPRGLWVGLDSTQCSKLFTTFFCPCKDCYF